MVGDSLPEGCGKITRDWVAMLTQRNNQIVPTRSHLPVVCGTRTPKQTPRFIYLCPECALLEGWIW